MSDGAGEGTTMNDATGSAGGSYAVLRVENAGPIAKGEVRLRPLTIFVGPGNTGKSWFATLAYAVLNDVPFNRAFFDHENRKHEDEFKGTFLEHADVWARQAYNRELVEFTEVDWRKLKSIMEMAYANGLGDYILRCFGLSAMDDLVRKGADSDMRIELRMNPGEAGELVCELKSGRLESEGKCKCSVNLPDREHFLQESGDFRSRLRRDLDYWVSTDDDELQYPAPEIYRNAVVKCISRALRSNTPHAAWYIPAERSGIIHAQQGAKATLLDQIQRYKPSQQPTKAQMHGIRADFLHNLAMLSINTSEVLRHEIKAKRERNINARNMENRMLGGRVNLEKAAEKYPRFSWTPDGCDEALPLVSASSMVTELIPVVIYLRHFVDRGEALILEEPEAHLHPLMQIEFARLIAEWVRAGIRVILITHSDWILDELSNLVGEARRKPENGLPEDHVGLWSFTNVPGSIGGGTHIREVRWDIDEGGFENGTENAAADQHNRWIDIIDGESE